MKPMGRNIDQSVLRATESVRNRSLSGAKVPGKEVVDLLHGMVGDILDHVGR